MTSSSDQSASIVAFLGTVRPIGAHRGHLRVGVFGGFDLGSRRRTKDTLRLVAHLGHRPVEVHPSGVADPLSMSGTERERIIQRFDDTLDALIDALIDASPTPRLEAERLAGVLSVPLLVLGISTEGERHQTR